jgi:hypothetical protein
LNDQLADDESLIQKKKVIVGSLILRKYFLVYDATQVDENDFPRIGVSLKN